MPASSFSRAGPRARTRLLTVPRRGAVLLRRALGPACLALALPGACWALDTTAGRPGGLFNFGAGARALAMGSANTASVNDVTSVYYNPAGLGLLPGREITLMHAKLFEGAAYDYLGYAQNYRRTPGGWGAEIIRLGVGGADGYDALNQPTGSFGYTETAFAVGSAWRGVLHPLLSFGFAGKMLQRQLSGTPSDTLYGADVGVQMGPWLGDRLMVGLVVQNAASFKQGDTDDALQSLVRLGAAFKVAGPLSLVADYSDAREFRVGTEYSFGVVALRFGLAQQGLSFGGGLTFRNRYSVDYAMCNNSTLGMSQRISLGYRFAGAAGTRGGGSTQMRFYAAEFLNNAKGELQKRNYQKAFNDFSAALGIDPKVGSEWRAKTDRLGRLLKRMEIETHPEDSDTLAEQSLAAQLAGGAIDAYMGREEDQAMVLAHAALGQEPASGVYGRLLDSLASLTGRPMDRDQVLPPQRLAELKVKRAMDAIYVRRFEVAVSLLREALWLDPGSALAWTRLGSAYFASGNRVMALAAYQEALKRNPQDAQKLEKFIDDQKLR